MNPSQSGVEVYISDPFLNSAFRKLFLLDIDEAEWYLVAVLLSLACVAALQRLAQFSPYLLREIHLQLKIASLIFFGCQTSDISIAKTLMEIGLFYKAKGNERKALEHFEDSLVILETSYGANSPSTAACHTLIASVLGEVGHFDASMGHFDIAISLLEDETAEGNITLHDGYETLFASIWNNMAVVEKRRGRLGKALLYYKKALNLFEEAKLDVEAAVVYNNMGLLFLRLGKRSEALMASQKAIDLKRKNLGNSPVHLSIAISYTSQGMILTQMERYDEAMTYHLDALKIKNRMLGARHRSIAHSQSEVASITSKVK